MAGVEDRVVSASFDNAKFKTAVAETLAALTKLNAALKLDSSKFDQGTSKSISALDRLKAALKLDSSKFKSDTDATTGALGKLKSALHIDGKKFQEDTEKSVGVLGRLKNALHLPGATKGLENVSGAAKRITFDGIGRGADAVSTKISAMSVVAVTALANIANRAVTAGGTLVKSLTIGPISGGLKEYETNLNSVQTILANTAASGAKLRDVNAALLELNEYSDKTIYNFGEMAKNIGTFTAAGVDLKTSVASIKGISNIAALSGSSSAQAATAMYQLSQEISAGRVSLQGWNSVVNAGMGGTIFQRALATTAVKMGKLDEGAVKLTGSMKNVTVNGQSFRESIMTPGGIPSWLTSDVLTTALQQFTGDLSDAELAAQGFSKAEIMAIQEQAKNAVHAATEVKTLSGVIDTARESAGSGWAQTWQLIFGDFGEAKSLFTGVSNAINGFIGSSADARNKVVGDWKELGGRTLLIEGVKNAFEALRSVISPIKSAFRQIFPAKTGQDLFELTKKFSDFMEKLAIGPGTAAKLQHTFAGLFAILSIGKQIIGGVFEVIKTLFSQVGQGSGDFLYFTSTLGDSLVALNDWLKEGDRLKNFFRGVGRVLAAPIAALGEFKDFLIGLFDGVDVSDADALGRAFDELKSRLQPLAGLLNIAGRAWDGLIAAFSRVKTALQPTIDAIVDLFGNIASMITDAISNSDFDTIFDVLQTTLVGGIFLVIKKALGGGLNIDIGGGLLKGLTGAFDALTGSLKTMQTSVQAATLIQIAGAMAVLAVSIVALSKVNAEDLSKSLTAIAVGFGQLVGAMAILSKAAGGGLAFAKMPIIASSLVLLAGAMLVLSGAVRIMATMSWDELARGLTGIGGALLLMSGAALVLGRASPMMLASSVGLIALAAALNIIAAAVKIFATMSWGDMVKGLVGVAGALVAIAAGVTLIPPSVLLIGPGLIAVGVALGIIAAAVAAFGSMNLSTLAKGLGGVAASMLIIAAAIALMPPTMPLIAAGLILVGVALTSIAGAVALMGNLSLGTLAKGIGAVAAILVVLAAGLTAMIASLPGAAALIVAAGALALIAPVIGILGRMSWGTIFKGLAAIGAALIVIGVAGGIAAPLLLILGVGLGVLGVGILAVGAGVNLLAKGLSLMASEGAKGVAVLIAAITGLLLIIPKIALDFAKGLVEIVKAIALVAPQIVDGLVKILITLLDAVIKAAPKMADAMTALLQAMLKVIRDNFPSFVKTGFQMLMAFLQGVEDNIERVTDKAIDIAVLFVKTIINRLTNFNETGKNVLNAFIRGITERIASLLSTIADIISRIIGAVTDARSRFISSGSGAVINFIKGITDKFGSVVTSGRELANSIVDGVADKAATLVSSGANAVRTFAGAVGDAASSLVAKGRSLVTEMVSGISSSLSGVVNSVSGQLSSIGSGIVGGIAAAVRGAAGQIISALGGVVGSAVEAAKRKLHIKSPSRVFYEIGMNTMRGLELGITNEGFRPLTAVETMANAMVDSISSLPEVLAEIVDLDPTIRPVLDMSSVQRDASTLNRLFNQVPIGAGGYQQATAISAHQLAQSSAALDDSSAAPSVTEVKFEQNLYSPEALSAVEVYRQTRNQLSQAKTLLGIAS